MSQAGEIEVPEAVERLRLLERVAYADTFCATTSAVLTPEQWLRAVIQEAPSWFRFPWLALGWSVLGAQVGPLWGSPGHVAGWRILRNDDDICVIGIDASRGLSARLASVDTPGQVVVATQIQLDPGLGERLWPAIRRGHRFFLPYLIERAVQRAEQRPPSHNGVPVAAQRT